MTDKETAPESPTPSATPLYKSLQQKEGGTGVPPVFHGQDAHATSVYKSLQQKEGGTGVPPVFHGQDAHATSAFSLHRQDAHATSAFSLSVGASGSPAASVEDRVEDLLGRMTDQEKVRQMDQYFGTSFAVDKIHPRQHTCMADDATVQVDKVREVLGSEGAGCIHDLYPTSAEATNRLQRWAREETRLGIPILFSEEALHGLARPGCTVFPQAISLAATWDPELAERVGAAIAAETRSFGIHEAFCPVIDLARDPRWGRVEETYGEDTHLAARMAAAMVRGMQGTDLKARDRIVAEPKHFFGYGASASGLNCGPCHLSRRELEAYYLPVFEAAVAEAGALNVMCSYNSIDGEPCASNRRLLTDVLRGKWNLRGFVRSDLGAVRMLQTDHCTAASAEEAIRLAVEAGLDMQYYDYDHEEFQSALARMLEAGSIERKAVDRAVRCVLRVKFLLGLFDDPYTDPELAKKTVRCQAHQDLALEAARQSICLLKNEGDLLPLPRNIASIAVIGPSANAARLGDYTPVIEGFEPLTVLDGIRRLASPGTRVAYVKGAGILPEELDPIPAECLRTPNGDAQGLRGEYFNGPDPAGEPVLARIDAGISFNWILAKPCGEISAQEFSVRWTGKLRPSHSFDGYLGVASQDSMRLWVDGDLLVDGWGKDKTARQSRPFRFEAEREYDLRVEYRRDTNGAQILLGWNRGGEEIEEAVRAAREADVAVVALGDSTETCGENLDRCELNLPGRQLELLQAVHGAGVPVILVLQNGRPMTIAWEAEHIPAILECWYGGEKGGQAIAEALFGEINPAGRLPMTFPKSVGQLPIHTNRRRGGGRRYIDGDHQPLFAFGHGLSYTTFQYANLVVTPGRIAPQDAFGVRFDVTNTGDRPGDEVAQLYMRDRVSSVVSPLLELKRFARVHLQAGETRSVVFKMGPKDLQLLNRDFEWVVEMGVFEVMVGSSSDRLHLRGEVEVAPA